jgi:phage-related protein
MDIIPRKNLVFLGNTLDRLRSFPKDVRADVGKQLDRVQKGGRPQDWKPMPSIGRGVEACRTWDESGTYRTIYVARFENAVYVLHIFQKKSQKTNQKHCDLARKRLKMIEQGEK